MYLTLTFIVFLYAIWLLKWPAKLCAYCLITIGLCVSIVFAPAFANEQQSSADLEKLFNQLKVEYTVTRHSLGSYTQTIKKLDDIQSKFFDLNLELEECISSKNKDLKTITADVALLGEQESSEDIGVRAQRKNLTKQTQEIDNQIKLCNLLKIQLTQLADENAQYRTDLQKQQLFSKEHHLLQALMGMNTQKVDTGVAGITPKLSQTIKQLSPTVFFVGLAGLLLGGLWQRRTQASTINASNHASVTFYKGWLGIQRTALLLGLLFFIWVFLNVQTFETTALSRTTGFALLLTLTFALIRGVLFSGAEDQNRVLAVRTQLITLIALTIIFSVIAFALNQPAMGRYLGSNLLYLIWYGAMVVATCSFIMLLHRSIHHVFQRNPNSFYIYIPIAVMVAIIFAAALGYRNLASQVFLGLTLTLVVLFLMFFFIRSSNEFFDGLDQGKLTWQSDLRQLMSVKAERAFPGVIWLRILSFFAVLFLAVSALITIWGGPQQHLDFIKGVLQNGLTIGSLNFDLVNIAYAILIIILGLGSVPFIKNKLLEGWLAHSNLSSGAKDATKTLIGYLIIGIALLSALFIIGMNFQNLAIIAGALSVGIGFGLQNIVNNFVSGLIILFERPIRRGDWVVVGNTEGYVRDISIRSTTIQTFDKAEVIVPNSELISNQVTNWMLSSHIGRVKAPIGVSYDADPKQVMAILEDVANAHPEVIKNSEVYPVHVIFLEFGDSALLFELRCYIRDVNYAITVKSQLNLGIAEAFKQHGIEIPYPQRVLHTNNQNESAVKKNEDKS